MKILHKCFNKWVQKGENYDSLSNIYSLFRNNFDIFNIPGAKVVDYIFHNMTLFALNILFASCVWHENVNINVYVIVSASIW